jgi:hypothetical protein
LSRGVPEFTAGCRTRRWDDAGPFRCDGPARASVRRFAFLKARARAARVQQERNARAVQHRALVTLLQAAEALLKMSAVAKGLQLGVKSQSQGCAPAPSATAVTPRRTCQACVLPGHTALDATVGFERCHGPWHGVPACDGIRNRLSQVCRQVVTKLMYESSFVSISSACRIAWSR